MEQDETHTKQIGKWRVRYAHPCSVWYFIGDEDLVEIARRLVTANVPVDAQNVEGLIGERVHDADFAEDGPVIDTVRESLAAGPMLADRIRNTDRFPPPDDEDESADYDDYDDANVISIHWHIAVSDSGVRLLAVPEATVDQGADASTKAEAEQPGLLPGLGIVPMETDVEVRLVRVAVELEAKRKSKDRVRRKRRKAGRA